MLVRAAGLILIVLGLLFWSGHLTGLVPLHILVGLVLVLALWALAVLGARAGVGVGLAAGALFWGLVVLVLGLSQAAILPGGAHWVVQVLHLIVGIAAIGLAEMLGGRIKRSRLVKTV